MAASIYAYPEPQRMSDFSLRRDKPPPRPREAPMSAPVSIRLDDDVRETLEAEAGARHVGLSTYLRQVATETAMRLRRERIRAQSGAVGEYVASAPKAAAFYRDWGTP